ncbi:ferritin-like domain-containing protein [Meiothermus rufus]|uniref:ferritin-like domain-containing protein n=1 Tax=Meiothermus rufus TaxID=604332 RepID=UPI000408C45D|nr:ferritin-like domain-containing protein [Meiothermus rufus]
MSTKESRRAFLKLLGLGGITLSGLTQANEPGDLAILSLALTAEQLATAAYNKAVAARHFTGPLKTYLEQALRQEAEHVKAIAKAIRALEGRVPDEPKFTFNQGAFENPLLLLRLLNTLEEAFVGAYLGALPLLRDKSLVAVAGSILGVEAGHRVLIREARLAFRDPTVTGVRAANDREFEQALSPDQARAALTPFLPR